MLSIKHLYGKEKLEKKKRKKEELVKSQQGTLEKFVFKMVDTQNIYINTIILNEIIFIFFLPKAHKKSRTTLDVRLLNTLGRPALWAWGADMNGG
jgi:hypothetical protein